MANRSSVNQQHLVYLRQQETQALARVLQPMLQPQVALLAIQDLERQRLQQQKLLQALAASQHR